MITKADLTDYILSKNGKKVQVVYRKKYGIIEKYVNEKGKDDFIFIDNSKKFIDVRPFQKEHF